MKKRLNVKTREGESGSNIGERGTRTNEKKLGEKKTFGNFENGS